MTDWTTPPNWNNDVPMERANVQKLSTGLAHLKEVISGTNVVKIVTEALADLCVTTAKMANLAVTTAKIADLAITTAKIGDSQVTAAKLAEAYALADHGHSIAMDDLSDVEASDPETYEQLVYSHGTQVSAPASAPTVADGGAGNLTGTFTYKVTFTDAYGETESGPASASTGALVSRQVSLTSIPTGGNRNIYRSSGGAYQLIGTIADSSTTTFTDNNVSPGAALSDVNTTGELKWRNEWGGHVIFDGDGVKYTQRPFLAFEGMTIEDDALNNKTVISGGGSGGLPITLLGDTPDGANEQCRIVIDTGTGKGITAYDLFGDVAFMVPLDNPAKGYASPIAYEYMLHDSTVPIQGKAGLALHKFSNCPTTGDTTGFLLVNAYSPLDYSGIEAQVGKIDALVGNSYESPDGWTDPMVTLYTGLRPYYNDTHHLGDSFRYWASIHTNNLYYKTMGTFPVLDDVAIIKAIHAAAELVDGKHIIDPEKLPPEVRDESGQFVHSGNMQGLLLGAIAQLAEKVESQEQRIAALEERLAELG